MYIYINMYIYIYPYSSRTSLTNDLKLEPVRRGLGLIVAERGTDLPSACSRGSGSGHVFSCLLCR